MGKDKYEEAKRKGQSRGLKRNRGGIADWATVDAEKIRTAICCAASVQGALRFGYTSDGGAYAIGIYGDGDPYTEYCRPGEDIEALMDDVIELFTDLR